MNSDQRLVDRFTAVRAWQRGDERAPHKPVVLLAALAQVQRGGGQWLAFSEVEDKPGRLLEEFGPPRQATHLEDPFWRLQNDDLAARRALPGCVPRFSGYVPRTDACYHSPPASWRIGFLRPEAAPLLGAAATTRTQVDIRAQPAYPLVEAARYVKLAPATLRSWVVGRSYPKREGTGHFRPLITPPDRKQTLLSFWNLVEAHVLRALRTEHGVSIKAVRSAIAYAEKALQLDRLLLSRQLCTHAGDVLLEKYGELVNLSKSGQMAIRILLQAHLRRVEWDEDLFPLRLFPIVRDEAAESGRLIAIDPQIAFGRPIVYRRGISTAAITGRIDAGESVEDIAADYEIGRAHV